MHPSTGVKSVQELIALAKSKPGEILYASTGVGTAPHLSGELLSMRAGVKLVHVPYQGSPQAATDLLAGRVSMMFSPASAVISQVEAGSAQGAGLGGVETAGHPAERADHGGSRPARFRHQIWFGLMAPAGTPRQVIDKLARAVRRGAQVERRGGGLAPAGHRSARRRPGGLRPPHRQREQALERRRPGGGAEEVIAALSNARDLLAEPK